MSNILLDAHVKGSLPSASSVLNPTSSSSPSTSGTNTPSTTSSSSTLQRHPRTPKPPSNPLDAAPSSPQQIYLNLLILEASLRSQYLTLTLRRRKYTFFTLLCILWSLYFGYALFVLGPSPYAYVSVLQKLALGAGVVTLGLFWLSGLQRKTMVFPRKFVGNTNKGLRQFNIKLVSVKLNWRERIMGWLIILPGVPWLCPYESSLPYVPPGEIEKGRPFLEVLRSFLTHGNHAPPAPTPSPGPGTRKRRGSHLPPVDKSRIPTPPPDFPLFLSSPVEEEPLQPSGSHVKLVILPKGFSPDFREGWEIYRQEYWWKENERRAQLRQQLKKLKIQKTQQPSTPPAHTHLHPSSRRITPETSSTFYLGGTSRSPTPEPAGYEEGGSPSPSRRPRRASIKQHPSRRGVAGTLPSTGGERPPIMSPLTPLRSEILPDEAGDISDAGSVRSVAGSLNEGGEGRPSGGRILRGSKKTRGQEKRKSGGKAAGNQGATGGDNSSAGSWGGGLQSSPS